MFNLTVDRDRGLLRLQLSGFWSATDFARFKKRIVGAVTDLGTGPGQHMILVDLREATLQTQELISNAQDFIANAENKARRIALVAASALARMQTKRLVVRPGVVLFETIEEAERWLSEEE